QAAVRASQLMEKHPGMCVARPEVFKYPRKSLLWPDEFLLPGNKYLMIPTTTARKLTRKHTGELKVKRSAEVKDETVDANITWDSSEDFSEESVCSAKDFYVSRDREPKVPARKSTRAKKPFVPPLPRGRSLRVSGWEPSLTSVQELSP
ncbi:hypothetical protein Tsubulata_047935, partial [Turnera subulata]